MELSCRFKSLLIRDVIFDCILSNKNGGYYLNFNGEGLISFDRSSSLYIRLVHDEKPITGNLSNAIADKAVAP
ncbi:hypothetical protein LBMAG43_09300 [Methylococcaceae bacterium]|nr:hypothetical protein LBMAG43_09300 [Methylococcaceae bacterium]